MASQPTSVLLFWVKPVSTTRALLEADRGHGLALLIAALFGVVQSLRSFLSAESPNPAVLFLAAAVGLVGLYLFGLLFRIAGRWLKGDPKPKAVRTSVGLGLLPWTLLFGLVFWLAQSSTSPEAIAGYYPVFFILFLYGYIILLLSLTVSLGLNVWKTFLCVIITFIGSLYPLLLIARLVFGAPGTAIQ